MPMYTPPTFGSPTGDQQDYLKQSGRIPGDTPATGDGFNWDPNIDWSKGYMSFDETQDRSAVELFRGFGVKDWDAQDRAALESLDYGWKADQQTQNMYAGVGQAMGQTGAALQQMRDQASSLASQSGIRRGRGGMEQASLYDQYQTGLEGLSTQRQQGLETMRHQWYDDITSLMGRLKAGQEG